MSSYKLNISNPCTHKIWIDLELKHKSNFCTNCKKQVYNFANCTDQEITAFLKNNNKNICARLDPNQIKRTITDNTAKNKIDWQQYAAGILLFTSTYAGATDGMNNKNLPTIIIKTNHNNKDLSLNVPQVYDSTKDVIFGTVLDLDSKNPIPNIIVRIEGTEVETITDVNGRFRVFLPKNYSDQRFSLNLIAKNFELNNAKHSFHVKQLPLMNLIIELESSPYLIGEISIIKPKNGGSFGKSNNKSHFLLFRKCSKN